MPDTKAKTELFKLFDSLGDTGPVILFSMGSISAGEK
jgi:hypothetical protein